MGPKGKKKKLNFAYSTFVFFGHRLFFIFVCVGFLSSIFIVHTLHYYLS